MQERFCRLCPAVRFYIPDFLPDALTQDRGELRRDKTRYSDTTAGVPFNEDPIRFPHALRLFLRRYPFVLPMGFPFNESSTS